MKAGISTATIFPEHPTEEAAEIIKSLGAPVAEVFLSSFYEYRPEFSKALAPKTEGLEVNSVHTLALNFENNLFNPTRRVRGDGFYWLDQVCRSAQLLRCKNYTFHGYVRTGEGDIDVGYVADRLNETHAFAAGYGVNICLENTAKFLFNRPNYFSLLKDRCPDLYTVFDIKQARRSGYPYQMYIKAMAGRIAYVHLSDVDEGGNMVLPGKGVYDFAEILNRLKDAGFDGNVIIENYRNDFSDYAELKQSLEFLQELCYKLD